MQHNDTYIGIGTIEKAFHKRLNNAPHLILSTYVDKHRVGIKARDEGLGAYQLIKELA